MRIWEVGRQAGTSVLRGHTSYIYPVAYSGTANGSPRELGQDRSLVGRGDRGELRDPAPAGYVLALAFSPDSTWLASGCAPGESLNIWNVATARLEHKFKGPGRIDTRRSR